MIHAKMGSAVHPQRVRFALSKKLGFPETAIFWGLGVPSSPLFLNQIETVKSCHNLKKLTSEKVPRSKHHPGIHLQGNTGGNPDGRLRRQRIPSI